MTKVGLCGFSMSMTEYPRHFPIVEVQQTFYEPPSDKLLKGWRARMPIGFEMAIKAWQLITHEGKSPTYRRMKQPLTGAERASCGAFRDSAVVRRALARTLACAAVVDASVVVFQSPDSFRPDPDNVKALYAALAEFGAPLEGLKAADFMEPDMFFRMGAPPLMVDILPAIQGVDFDSAWERRTDMEIDPESGYVEFAHAFQKFAAAAT